MKIVDNAEIRDANGNIQTFGYDAFGNMKSMTDANGHKVNYTYDTKGNKLTQYETVTTVNGPETVTTRYEYDSKNRVVKTTYPDGRFSTTEYNAIDKRSATVDADGSSAGGSGPQAGRRTEFEYDNNGNLILTRYHDGTTETSTYDSKNRRISSIDREGIETRYEYDSRDNQVKVIRYFGTADESFTQTIYNLEGMVAAEIDALNNMTYYEYYDDGSRKLVRNALNEETHYTYDADGQMDTMTSPAGTTFKYYYDNRGRQVESTWLSADGTVETTIDETAYDNAGRMTSKTDANGNTTSFTYDPSGRLLTVTDALTNVTSYTYDERGHKLTQTDANTHTTTWAYDKMGRQVSRTLPMGQTETFTYNTDGTLATKTDFNGNSAVYSYDPIYKRLVSVSYTDGSSESYAYEPVSGRRLTATNSNGTTGYEYYPVTGRLMQVNNPDGTWVMNEWDQNGNKLTETTANTGTVWTYDALNRISSTNGLPHTYNSHGKPATVTTNENIRYYTYDELGRLVYEEIRDIVNVVTATYTYELDTLGNRTKVTELSGKTYDYEYDELNRLTSETETEGGEISTTVYTYDPTGNRLTKTVDGVVTTYTYDANDRMTSDGTQTYTYDNNGNTLSDGIKTFTYDSKNRLVSFINGTNTVSYTYDTDNMRTSKTVNSSTTNYVLCKTCQYARVIEELDGNGTIVKSYTYGNDLLGSDIGGTYYDYVTDGHGSVRMMTTSGVSVAEYDYNAYGELTSESGSMSSDNDFRYAGQQYDPDLDQYYLRARYYNQNVGRFSSMDDWQGSLSRPLSLNKYNYTESNPVMGIDQSGRMNLLELSATLAVITIMSQTAIAMPTSTGICKGKVSSHRNKYKLFDTMDEAAYEAERKGFAGYTEDINNFEVAVEISWEKPKGCGKECFYANEAHMGVFDSPYWVETGKTRYIPNEKAVDLNWGVLNIAGFWHSHTGDYNNWLPSSPENAVNYGGDYETVGKIRKKYEKGYGYLTTAEDKIRVKFGVSVSEIFSW